jgi:hypothetical protein
LQIVVYAKLLRATQFAASSKSLRIGYRPIRHDPRIRLAAAFEPDVGESVADLSDKMPAAAKSVGPVGDGFLAVDPDAFAANFAADPPKPVARFMAISQVPVAGDAFGAKASVAAWKQQHARLVQRLSAQRGLGRIRLTRPSVWLLVRTSFASV